MKPAPTLRIPEGVREAIGRRLNRLSEECNRALGVAAVIGREFDYKLLSLLEPIDESALLEALEEALEAHVIEEEAGGRERYRFSHALIQQTLVSEQSATRRVRLHARIAEALESLYGDEAEAHAGELAHHFAEAESALGTERLVRYSALAGEQALAVYAYEDGLAHFQRALAGKAGDGR